MNLLQSMFAFTFLGKMDEKEKISLIIITSNINLVNFEFLFPGEGL